MIWYLIGYLLVGLALAEGGHWASEDGCDIGPYLWLLLGWPIVTVSLLIKVFQIFRAFWRQS